LGLAERLALDGRTAQFLNLIHVKLLALLEVNILDGLGIVSGILLLDDLLQRLRLVVPVERHAGAAGGVQDIVGARRFYVSLSGF